MKKILIIITLLNVYPSLYASKPMVALTGVYSDSHRAKPYSAVIEGHLNNIVKGTQVFDIINPKLLKDELKKYNCLDEKCLLRFSSSAKMDILIKGKLVDKGRFLILNLSAYGMARPYYGKLIYRYKVKIANRDKFYSKQFGFIYEEHCANFVSNFLMKYEMSLKISYQNNSPEFLYDEIFSGNFKLYRFKKKGDPTLPEIYSTIGKISVKNSKIKSQGVEIKDGDFIFLNFKEKGRFLNSFYYGRKREVIFSEPLVSDTILFMLFTIPASASMPLMAPIFGYYQNSDWPGLALWTVNYSPYLYLQVDGLVKRYGDARDRGVDFSRDDITISRFAMYMLFTGGSSLFVDAFSHEYLKGASNYDSRYSFMGNGFTAGYLALISEVVACFTVVIDSGVISTFILQTF